LNQSLFQEIAMGILLWIMFGLVAGVVARYVMPGPDPLGIVATILLGVAGAVVAGAVGAMVGVGTITGFDVRSLCLAIIGSLAVLFAYRTFAMRGAA